MYGDQVIAKQCYFAMVNTKGTMKFVQLVEEEREVLKDVSRILEEKVVKELVHYELDEKSSDHFFLIVSNLRE